MKTTEKNSEKRIIVAFHISGGGGNRRRVKFIGEKNLDDLISMNERDLYYQDRTPDGRFSKPYITDCNGNIIVDTDEYGKETGVLNFDNDYDTYTCCYIDECDFDTLELIDSSNEWKSVELEEYLNAL